MSRFEFAETEISGMILITPFFTEDQRGAVLKDYSCEVFGRQAVSFDVKETLYILSYQNVLRGLHVQRIKEQPKLVRCICGHVWSVAVDLRPESATLGKWICVDLTPENKKELLIPGGCALGTLALADSVLSCKYGEDYDAAYADGIRWNDPQLGIRWPLHKLNGKPVISQKDQCLQSFRNYLEKGGC